MKLGATHIHYIRLYSDMLLRLMDTIINEHEHEHTGRDTDIDITPPPQSMVGGDSIKAIMCM